MISKWINLALVLEQRDPLLKPFIQTIGKPNIQFEKNAFRSLVESILSQQLAPKAAQSIIKKFSALHSPFPTPLKVEQMKTAHFTRAGVSPQKSLYLKDLAKHWKKAHWKKGWDKMEDADLITRLTEVHGIGEWTAQMFLIFSLGRPNVLPTGDYGIRRGIQMLHTLPEMPKPSEVEGRVVHWKGAYSVGSWYLWRALDLKLLLGV